MIVGPVVTIERVKESGLNTLNTQNNQVETPARETLRAARPAYREIPGIGHETKDVLKQLDANIRVLEDLSGRLGFVMSEIRGLIRR